jgi:DNA-binding LacI/PurR family transcriptional regulator
MTTVYDIGRVAGVSAATASRVMRGSALVNPATREPVLTVIEARGFAGQIVHAAELGTRPSSACAPRGGCLPTHGAH